MEKNEERVKEEWNWFSQGLVERNDGFKRKQMGGVRFSFPWMHLQEQTW